MSVDHIATSTSRRAASAQELRRPWNSHQWCRYFRRNATELLTIDWDLGAGITPAEQRCIARSVREFQLGESAEGRHFIQAAKAYASRTGDRGYVEAVRLLIGEEQRHARELARFLVLAGIPLAQKTWADSAFRWLRKRAGLEICVAVLVTAEIIAKVYYAALRGATNSSVLRSICQQILQDEVEHVRFQSERLAILRARRPPALVTALQLLHRFAFAVACLVVWRNHRAVFRAGGYGFRRFWGMAWHEMRQALGHMMPARRPSAKFFGRVMGSTKS